jgi:Domain of unknown function (DUF4397)
LLNSAWLFFPNSVCDQSNIREEVVMRKIAFVLFVFVLAMVSLMPVLGQDAPEAHIRVAHFSPDAPAVDIFANGSSLLEGVTFPQVSGWITVRPGTYQVAVRVSGGDALALGPESFTLEADQWVTIAAVGSVEAGTLAFAPVVEDYSAFEEAGQARVTVFHAIVDAPPVDVLAGDAEIVNLLAFPGRLGSNDGAFSLTVPAGRYNLRVVPDGLTDTLLDLSGTILVANRNYLVAAVGTAAAPDVVVIPTIIE